MSREDFDGGYSEWAKEQHKKRVADNSNRIQYAIEQFEKHNIEYALKNETTGHFHCRRKSDDKLFQFYAGTGKIMGYENKRGIHSLIRLLDDMRKEDEKMDEYNCGDCARFYSVDEWNGECPKHGCVNCMSKICKDFILNDTRKEDEGK